jgi:hypothetical protein
MIGYTMNNLGQIPIVHGAVNDMDIVKKVSRNKRKLKVLCF